MGHSRTFSRVPKALTISAVLCDRLNTYNLHCGVVRDGADRDVFVGIFRNTRWPVESPYLVPNRDLLQLALAEACVRESLLSSGYKPEAVVLPASDEAHNTLLERVYLELAA